VAKKRKQDDPLAALLETASKAKLVDLLVRVASTRPAVRRECLDYLNRHTTLSPSQKKQSDGEKLLALWSELVPDLDELDTYGGGDYDADSHVSSLLHEIAQALSRVKIETVYRKQLLDNVLPYIESGNAGLDDDLYDVTYATSYTDTDWRALAKAFETMGGDWKIDHARRIYRQLGDREKFLELRQRKLATGADYHDLAEFHWKAGEKQKAMEVAEAGLLQGKGRMDELRQFVAKRVKSAGNHERYLALQFDQAIDPLTCDNYKAFRKLCTTAEWKSYEAKMLAQLENAWDTEQLRIRMHRKEHEQAVAVLTRSRYPLYAWDSAYELQTARRLEGKYPEAILKYYLSGLCSLKTSAPRKEYTRKAQVMKKVHHVLVDVLKDASRWRDFAIKIKKDNIKRPAFQEEFTKAVPGWQALK
jgi:tetratricopeptide (TPR) repeat protein